MHLVPFIITGLVLAIFTLGLVVFVAIRAVEKLEEVRHRK